MGATTRKPHYTTASEQVQIEFFAPDYLRHVIVIMVEMGCAPKELMPMRRDQVDLETGSCDVPDSKTENGIADMRMTDLAYKAFTERMAEPHGSGYLFPSPSPRATKPYIGSLKKVWNSTLRRAKVPYFTLYELRHAFAPRLSASGVADHFVTQLLRQGDSAVFQRYSQAKLNRMRAAQGQLNRHANESPEAGSTFGTPKAV